jgi:hypothetical protein
MSGDLAGPERRLDDGLPMPARFPRLLLLALVLVGCDYSGAAVEPAAAEHATRPVGAEISAAPRVVPEPTERPMRVSRPAPTARPTPQPTPASTLPPAAAFALDLFQDGDFVPQHTFEWCVGASIQMAHNLVLPHVRNSYDDQQALWQMARDRSSNSFNGANPRGWAAALNDTGIGPYELVSIPDFALALRTAAAAIHTTGRPVGLVMWRGRHAWVMSGFESIGDPGLHRDFTVTGIRVLDPLFPHGSAAWGPSPAPNSLLSPEQLAAQFVVREPRRWSSDFPAGYILVLPVTEATQEEA